MSLKLQVLWDVILCFGGSSSFCFKYTMFFQNFRNCLLNNTALHPRGLGSSV